MLAVRAKGQIYEYVPFSDARHAELGATFFAHPYGGNWRPSASLSLAGLNATRVWSRRETPSPMQRQNADPSTAYERHRPTCENDPSPVCQPLTAVSLRRICRSGPMQSASPDASGAARLSS